MEFLFIASAHFVALLSPGPDFFLILQTSLRLPKKYGVALCGGIAIGNGVYICIAVLGLEAVREMTLVTEILKYCGGCYLIYIGITLLRMPGTKLGVQSKHFLHSENILRQFSIGFASAMLNPKNMIFYLSLFTVLVGPDTSFIMRAAYGIWMCSVVFIWDVTVVMLFGLEGVRKRCNTFFFGVEKISGGLLTLFGVFLPFT